MATSGSFDTTHRVSGSYDTYGHFEWSQASQSIADNQTKINFTFAGRTAGPNQWVYTYNAKCTVDGSSYGPWSGNMYNGTTMISDSKTITHSADGTKSFSASGSLAMVESNNTKSGSGSWSLNTIPRKATVTSAPNFNDEANPTISYENKAGNSVSSLQACIATTGDTIVASYRDISKTGTSYTFNLTSAERTALRNLIPNANSTSVRMYVKTVIGSNTFYDYKTVTFSITNGAPTFSNFTYADTNSTTTTITGNNQYIIQNKSSLRATISSANKAVANKGASMSTYTFAVSSYSGSANYSTSDINKDIGTINATTNQTLTITAKDSRGNTKAVSKTVSIVPYSTPSIVASVTRANNFEETTTISVRGAMSLLKVNGVTKNEVNSTSGVQYRYKDTSTSTWGSWTNIASTTAADGSVSTSSFILTLDNTKSFNFEFKITDKLETKTIAYTLAQGQPQFFVGSDGRVAVGGTPSQSIISGQTGLLEIKGNSYHIGSTGDVMTWAKRTDVNRSIRFGVGSGGTNAGIFDDNAAMWTLYDDKTRTYLPRFKESAYHYFCGGGSGSTAGRWLKVGTLNLASHNQGKMVWLRLNIGIGNNGTAYQNCYIDLIGQQGWTGSVSGRAGWNAEMHPLQTSLSTGTERIKVIAVGGSNLNYDIWFWTNHTYVAVTSVYFPNMTSATAPDFTWTPTTNGSWTATEPSGTACEIGHTVNTQGAVGITSATDRLDIGNWHMWVFNFANTTSGWVQKDLTLPTGFNTQGRVKHVTCNGQWGNSGDNRLGAWIQLNGTTLRLRIYQATAGSNGWWGVVFGTW